MVVTGAVPYFPQNNFLKWQPPSPMLVYSITAFNESVTYYCNSSKCLPPSLKLLPSLRGTSCSAKHGTLIFDLQCGTEEVAS